MISVSKISKEEFDDIYYEMDREQNEYNSPSRDLKQKREMEAKEFGTDFLFPDRLKRREKNNIDIETLVKKIILDPRFKNLK